MSETEDEKKSEGAENDDWLGSKLTCNASRNSCSGDTSEDHGTSELSDGSNLARKKGCEMQAKRTKERLKLTSTACQSFKVLAPTEVPN